MDITIMHAASVIGGLALAGASAWALIKFNPTPWRNVFYATLALGMFAVGTGSKIDISMDRAKGLQMKIADLEKKLTAQNQQIAELKSLEGNWTEWGDELAQLKARTDRYDRFLAKFSEAVHVTPNPDTADAVTFDPAKTYQMLQTIEK